ncbi:MAG: ABC transporter substrate-binding protein [Candidatus Hodarchaeales archaeon]|jgi:ABC-type transport system substrate-binding protein
MNKVKALLILVFMTINLYFIVETNPVLGQKVEWENVGREWYYDNLDDEDRQKIRQAIDYCIPRKTIIEGIYTGYGVAIPSPIGINLKGIYEDTIKAREYNILEAQAFLTDVFGLKYTPNIDSTNITHTNVPYFRITLIVPVNDSKMDYSAHLIANALAKVGIEVELDRWSKERIITDIFFEPIERGYDPRYGGFDMFLYNINASPDPTYKEYYSKDHYPPGENCYWIENGAPTSGSWTNTAYSSVNDLWIDIYSESNPRERTMMLKEYQQWCFDQVPTSIILQEMDFFGLNEELKGFNVFHGLNQNLANLTIGTKTSTAIAQSKACEEFNPMLTNRESDLIILDNIFCHLSRRRGDYNLTHAVPWLAESWNHSIDQLIWDVTLQQGILWEDGTEVTADDIVFSYQAAMNENTCSPYQENLVKILGTINAIEKTGRYSIRFELPSIYPYVETLLFGDPPIVQKAQMSQIPFLEWKNTDKWVNSTPIGCGAYTLASHPDNETVILKAAPYYNETKMGHNPNMIGGGNWLSNPHLTTVSLKVVKEPFFAIIGLQEGKYDIIDYQMDIHPYIDYINTSFWGKILPRFKWGHQEIGFNHLNPIFGMNSLDPRMIWYCPDPDPEGLVPLINYFRTYITIPIFVITAIIGLQITQQVKIKTVSSPAGLLVWYLTGTVSIIPSLINAVLKAMTYDMSSGVTNIIGSGFILLIWPLIFIFFLIFVFPTRGIGYECEDITPYLYGMDKYELQILSTMLFFLIITLGMSEFILRKLNRRRKKKDPISI